MNERIKQLYEQCNRVVDDPFSGAHISFDHQMFSELIVGECLDIVANADMTELEGPDPEDVLYVACKQIKQYFGVEE